MRSECYRYKGVVECKYDNENFNKNITYLIIKITISSLVIGVKNVLFSTNSLAKLLSDSLLSDSLLLDSLLSDSLITQSHSVITCAGARAVAFVFLPLTPPLSLF